MAQEYRAKYQAIPDLLDANDQLVTLAHRDWAKLLSTSGEGRDGYTSEQLLRTLIMMFLESRGFYQSMEQIFSLEERPAIVSIAKKGRRNQEQYERETSEEFIEGQCFRAGSEGSISVLLTSE